MARDQKTEALILRSVDYGEKDKIVTVLSPEVGKFTAIAKGARSSRKRFAGGLQPYRKLELLYTAKPQARMSMLQEMKVLTVHHRLESTYELITMAAYGTELAREVCEEGEEARRLFEALVALYEQLDQSEPDLVAREVLLRHFELLVLRLSGAAPSLRGCFRCGEAHPAGITATASRRGEGLVCESCRRPGERVGLLQVETLDVLWFYLRPEARQAPDALMDEETRRQARRVIDASLERLVSRPLKSRPLLDAVLA